MAPFDRLRMNLDALPQTVLLIMAEFSVGCLIAVLVADARGMVVASFVKLSGGLVVAAGALTVLAAVNTSGSDLSGYPLHDGLFGPIRGVFIAFLALAAVYALLVLRGRRRAYTGAPVTKSRPRASTSPTTTAPTAM